MPTCLIISLTIPEPILLLLLSTYLLELVYSHQMHVLWACQKEVDNIRGAKYSDNRTEKISGTINNLRLFPYSNVPCSHLMQILTMFTFNANPFSLNSLVFLVRSARMSSSQSTWICLNSCAKQMIIVLCTACMLWLSIMMLWIQPSLVIMYVMWRILRGSGTRWTIAR